MKKIVVLFALLIIGYVAYINNKNGKKTAPTVPTSGQPAVNNADSTKTTSPDIDLTTVIAQNLDTPWAIAFLPSGDVLTTERNGKVWLVNISSRQITQIADFDNVVEAGEGGLLGIAPHPKFSINNFVYLYYTYRNVGENTLNRVVRASFKDGGLDEEKIIVDAIPGAANHDGGRIKFGPDGYLYIGTGDAQVPSRAQDTSNLAGKILRVTDDGSPAPGNPFGNQVFSYGHRNVQGLAWIPTGTLFATEHGRSGVVSGLDELNLIEIGKNYGWPEIQGNETREGMQTPLRNSGNTTWAPSGMAYLNNSLYFSGLRGQSLYQAVLSGTKIVEIKEHFNGQFGRIRDVIAGYDNMLYITTSNRDGRGNPKENDDKIIRINPAKL